MLEKIISWFSRSEGITVLKAIRRGLMITIPVLLIGSFCLVLLNLPIPVYQNFIDSIPVFRPFFLAIYSVTLGVFSLYAAIGIGISYAQAYMEKHGDFFIQGAPFAALGAYLMLVGIGADDFSFAVLSTRSLIIAIIAGLGASALYCAMVHRPRRRPKGLGNTTDSIFNRALSSILPITIIFLIAAVVNTIVSFAFNVGSVEELFFQGISEFFPSNTSSLESGLLYMFLNNFLWFFGVHGGNMLDGVAQSIFLPGTAENAAMVALGQQPTEVITKTFMDVFASIGGAGALLSLLLAILIFGRQRNLKKLSKLAITPMVFNISELMLFGLPVIWNPTLLIPFILVPMVNLVVSYAATVVGLVPYVTVDVSWITPPLIGGYLATGSYAGVALQVFNLVLGMFIYLPFMRLYEKTLKRAERDEFEGLLTKFRQAELERGSMVLTTMPGTIGLLVRALSDDLRRAVNEGTFDLYYQPQFDINDKGIGAEALLRWNHPMHGMMYPPLVVKLAEEIGILDELELAVLNRALEDALRVQRLANTGALRSDFAISVNATARSLQNNDFVSKAIQGVKERHLEPGRLVIEATEHDALNMNDDTSTLLIKFIDAGIPLAIDDFSMGNTSFKYLETSAFSIVKLDGTIAKGVMGNSRYADIVSSITRLSEQLCFKVLAEYVETKEQRDQLQALGCTYFQGYLYSPAVPFEDMLKLVEQASGK